MFVHAGTGCRYEKLTNGIHYFTFDVPSRVAMDDWAAQLRRIISETPSGQSIRYIMDIRQSDILPVRLTYAFGREWFSERINSPHMRTAVIHNTDAHMTVTQDFIRLLRENPSWKFHFFDTPRLPDAYGWLLADS